MAALARQKQALSGSLTRCSDEGNFRSLAAVRRQKASRDQRSKARIVALKCRRGRVEEEIAAAVATALLRDSALKLRLERQIGSTERRLQELMFEVLGEFAKATARASRRSDHLSATVERELRDSARSAQWARFLLRAGHDLETVALEDITRREDFSVVSRLILAKLMPQLPLTQCHVTRMIRISRAGGRPGGRRQRDSQNELSEVVTSGVEVMDLLGSFARPKEACNEGAVQEPSIAAFDRSLLLSSRPVAWLLRPALGFRHVSSVVYFCVEEWAALPKSSPSPSLADAVSQHVLRTCGGSASVPAGERLEVTGVAGTESTALRGLCDSFPDILRAGGAHFAAASVENLATSISQAGRGRLFVAEAALETVCLSKGVSTNPVVGASLVSLPAQTLRELGTVYFGDTGNCKAATAAHVFPGPSNGGKYYAVMSPILREALGDDASGVLVEVSESGEPPMPMETGFRSGKWDDRVLWHFCRWRSCLAPATAHFAPRHLCTAHSKLKEFLDSRPGKGGESSRFLPKKPPQSIETDISMIKAASSLLTELKNGKLSSTIQSFCSRAAAESSDRHCQTITNGQSPPIRPPWARWSERNVDAALGIVDRDIKVAEAIAAAERDATSELQRLEEIGVFPTIEIALIRRERESRAAESSGGLTEIQSAERKLNLFRLRRQAAESQLE